VERLPRDPGTIGNDDHWESPPSPRISDVATEAPNRPLSRQGESRGFS
jgi:hypothetical protein